MQMNRISAKNQNFSISTCSVSISDACKHQNWDDDISWKVLYFIDTQMRRDFLEKHVFLDSVYKNIHFNEQKKSRLKTQRKMFILQNICINVVKA